MTDDTGMILFGILMIGLMGFLLWKASNSSTLKITEFVRDPKTNAIIQIIEK